MDSNTISIHISRRAAMRALTAFIATGTGSFAGTVGSKLAAAPSASIAALRLTERDRVTKLATCDGTNRSVAFGQNVVYVGNDPKDLALYEAWLGQQADGVQLHTGRNGWADWSGSINWLIDRWSSVGRQIFWSIPLLTNRLELDDSASGRFNALYESAAKSIIKNNCDDKVFIRTGWEFNGDWQPWSAINNPASYKNAFREFVRSFRSVSSRFVFEWTPNIGDYGMNPEDAYPGDDVVDVVGLDFYYDRRWDPDDPLAAWKFMVDRPYGLAWHSEFSRIHGKPVAYSEWAISSDRDSSYVRSAAKWFTRQDLVYQSYWNSNAAYPGKLSDNHYPDITREYKLLIDR